MLELLSLLMGVTLLDLLIHEFGHVALICGVKLSALVIGSHLALVSIIPFRYKDVNQIGIVF
ncbi:hypothetical protein [Halobacillus naozhouensis]|uniref:Uncharacterized protein n=1 Tax=Halobacillus naozhouensis TaxID=554880 RepID=A0ABY8IWJ3_9BACI|nr:hypothetical protein [Halobacillus naozhouensis]WFT73151.1 hypothetical protein P9989_12120 [Halobacillus naozhouensis]